MSHNTLNVSYMTGTNSNAHSRVITACPNNHVPLQKDHIAQLAHKPLRENHQRCLSRPAEPRFANKIENDKTTTQIPNPNQCQSSTDICAHSASNRQVSLQKTITQLAHNKIHLRCPIRPIELRVAKKLKNRKCKSQCRRTPGHFAPEIATCELFSQKSFLVSTFLLFLYFMNTLF